MPPFLLSTWTKLDHGQSTTDISGQYLHSEPLIDSLIKINQTITDKSELISLCKQLYERNFIELNNIEQFKSE